MIKFSPKPIRFKSIGAVFLCLWFAYASMPGSSIFALEHTSRQEGMSFALPSVPGMGAFLIYPLSLKECMSIEGGDVRMVLNPARNRLTVSVIDNEYEARLGRYPPREVYEIDVHNRIVDTRRAPFIPTAESRKQTSWAGNLLSRPDVFPEGYWNISRVSERTDKFGPYMVATNAQGQVDVFMRLSDDQEPVYIGTYADTGYAIHANTNPFEYSKSYGCLIARKEDLERLAKTLKKDREDDRESRQTLRISGRISGDR